MNEILNSLYCRKSVRAYEDRPIQDKDKQAILEAAIQAPTAGNMTLYSILDITDQALKDKLAITCDNQPFIAKAPLVLVFCADYYRWYQLFCRNMAEDVRRPGEGDLLLAFADTLIAAQNAVVAAESLGIGSCYIGDIIENFEQHRALLGLPKHVVPACMVCFGYPTDQQKRREKPARFGTEDIVMENGYDIAKADNMEQMLAEREKLNEDELKAWIERFCRRKWNCDFSAEMTRSAREIIKNFCE